MKECESHQIPELSDIEENKLNLKKGEFYKKKKTLVLDLDETLIHCVESNESEADLRFSIKL